MINPLLADEQLRGGVVQAWARRSTRKACTASKAQPLNGLADYLVPMAGEMPDITIAARRDAGAGHPAARRQGHRRGRHHRPPRRRSATRSATTRSRARSRAEVMAQAVHPRAHPAGAEESLKAALRKLGVAVCGLGWWGRTIAAPAGSNKLRIVLGVDLAGTVHFVPIERASTRRCNIPTCEAVVLCTPHTLHTDQIVAGGERRQARVLREAAVDDARRRAARGRRRARQTGVALAVGPREALRAADPGSSCACCEAGELGTPLQVEANFSQDKFLALPADNWRLTGTEAPAGPMTATGIHLLDLSVGVFGPAERCSPACGSSAASSSNGDTLAALVTFKQRRACADQRHPRHALRRALRRLRQQGLGRGARQGAPGGAGRLDADHMPAAAKRTAVGGLCRRRQAVLANLEAFADAAPAARRIRCRRSR